jgi:hypothetical protein
VHRHLLRPLVIRFGTAIVGLVLLAGCTSNPQSTEDPAGLTAPPGTLTTFPSIAPARAPEQVAQDDRATAQAAMPTDADVPGFARPAQQPATTLKLCPARTQTVPDSIVHTFGFWSGTGANEGRTLTVAIVLDPANAPADRLLATLLPQDCAVDANGFHYVYDRQPYERSDGWSGTLNTILATDTRTGAHSYESAFVLSKGDALVNVVAGRSARDTFDPSVDEAARKYLDLVLDRLAV